MRKITLLLALCLLISTLAACGGTGNLSGSYKSEGFISTVYTFSGTDKVTASTGGGLISAPGTYRIEGGTIYITTEMLGQQTIQNFTLERRGDMILLNGVKYLKQ